MSKTVRFCILGTNFISDLFAEAVTAAEGASICAVYSRTQATGQAFADRHGIGKVYTDMDAMLTDASIDAVYIATPNRCHYPMAKRALSAGKHVLCEKPMTECAEQTEELIRLSETVGRVLLEAMRPDFDPAYPVLREALLRIGRIRRVELSFCQYSSRYDRFRRGEVLNAFDPTIGNCALADIGIYPLHMAVSLFGEPSALTGASVFLSNGFEGAGQALLSYPAQGYTVCVSYSKIANGLHPSLVEGEDGSITVDKLTTPSRILLYPRTGGQEELYRADIPNNMVYEIDAFCSMVRGERPWQAYLSLTHRTMRVYDAIVRNNGIFPVLTAEGGDKNI